MMGYSMSKTPQSESGVGLDADDAIGDKTRGRDAEDNDIDAATHGGKDVCLVESYTDLDLLNKKEFSQPIRQGTKVIQILCAADDDDNDIDDELLNEICKQLESDTEQQVNDFQSAQSKLRPPSDKDHTHYRLCSSGPVFTSTLAERPTRIHSANFSPHAVVSDDDVSRYLEKEIEVENNSRNNLVLQNSNKKINVHVSLPVDNPANHASNDTDQVSCKDFNDVDDDQLKEDIKELLEIDVDPSQDIVTHKKAKNKHKRLRISTSKSKQSPTTARKSSSTSTPSRQVETGLDKSKPGRGHSSEPAPLSNKMTELNIDEASVQLCLDHLSEVRRRIKFRGFFDRFPTPTIVCDAQQIYRKMDLPPPRDNEGNILPHPPRCTKQDVFTAKSFGSNEIDLRILNAPQTLVQENNPRDVVEYLCGGLGDDVDKIRALASWLAVRQLHTTAAPKASTDMSKKWCKMFVTMCRCCQIMAKLVEGIIRGPKYLPDDDLALHRGVWVAVLVNSTWWIVDPALKKAMSDDFADTANKHLTVPADTRASPGLSSYTESFFSDPEHFIFTHYPDDKHWQLLARPVEKEELGELVLPRHGFFILGIKLGNQTRSVIVVEKEEFSVTLGFPEKSLRQFMCKLYHCGESGLESEIMTARGSVSLKRHLFIETFLNRHQVNVRIRLPKKGPYVLDIYCCSESQPWQKVITYKLLCEHSIVACPFLACPRDEWGPGMDANAMGLSPVSHHGGEIVVDKIVTQISFKDKTGLQFKHELLKENGIVDSDEVKLSFLRDKGHEVVFILDMEPKLVGTYVLQLSARSDTSKPYTNFCNYLINKVECGRARRNAIPKFDFNAVADQKTVHMAPDSGRLLMELAVPGISDLNVKFKLHTRQELNYSEHARFWIEENSAFVDLNFPRKGKYSVKIQAKTSNETRFETIRDEQFQVDIPSPKWSPFPKLEANWSAQFKIEEPLNHHLEEKEDETFTVCFNRTKSTVSGQVTEPARVVHDVAVLAAGGWYHLENVEEGVWRGQVWTGPRSTRCKLLARFEIGSEKFSELLLFKVMAEEDFHKLEDKQDTLREDAFRDRRHQQKSETNAPTQHRHHQK